MPSASTEMPFALSSGSFGITTPWKAAGYGAAATLMSR
jgi:hypothetical protein